MKTDQDVIIIGAGKIDVGMKERIVLKSVLTEQLVNKVIHEFGDDGLPGCRVESMMISYDPALPVTTGLVTTATAIRYWNRMTDLNMTAVSLHLQGYLVDNYLIENMKKIQKEWKD